LASHAFAAVVFSAARDGRIFSTYRSTGNRNTSLEQVETIRAQLHGAESTTREFAAAFEGSSEQTLKHIAAASRLVQWRSALVELRHLVADPKTTEGQFQRRLERNPWLFGSEYSELLTRRTWTRDDQLDYMLRRTADNYLEIVEIKTAFTDSLFVYDKDRDLGPGKNWGACFAMPRTDRLI
jgi:hypothetical protein